MGPIFLSCTPNLDPAFYIKREAAKCVACGLCLPHCPTYGLMQDEGESPRGRLSLMLALISGELSLSAKLESHLARCLGCRACETVCPSGVGYGVSIDSVRALIETTRAPISKLPITAINAVQWLAEKPTRVHAIGKFLRFYQWTGLQRLFRASKLLRLFGAADLEANLPKLSSQKKFTDIYPALASHKGEISLFTGCMARISDRQTLDSAIRLLNRLGYEVHVPPNQGCCGALHLHNGQAREAHELMRKNIQEFGEASEPVLSTASGCTATMIEYGKLLNGNQAAHRFSERVMDINMFLTRIEWSESVTFAPLEKRIAIHDPCTLVNVLRQADKPYSLLARIPGVELVPLPQNKTCCGAAGTYHLSQPSLARQLRAPKIHDLNQLAPEILVTTNPGCASFLASGIRDAGLAIDVMHPVTLLEKQMKKITSG